MFKAFLSVIALTGAFAPAYAAEKNGCADGLICASEPQTVVSAMQDEGYRAKLGKDDGGDPKIDSEASGYDFTIYFYDCKDAKDCKALQFMSSFAAEDDNTPEYANNWNDKKRFIKASVDKDKALYLQYDLSTIGGLNKENFADVLDWWSTMLGEFKQFVNEQSAKK